MEAGLIPRYPASSTGAELAAQQSDALKLRACTTCARMKMKCRWSSPGNQSQSRPKACTRCMRLEIPCEVPRDTPRKKRGKSTRVSQLEEKIDGIMSILAKQPQSVASSPLTPESQGISSSVHAYSQSNVQVSPQSRASVSATEEAATATRSPPRTRSAAASANTGPHGTVELLPGFRLTMHEAGEYLDLYRQEYMPQFPFVLIPETTTAPALYEEKPHLFWVIMASVVPQTDRVHKDIKLWFRQYLAEHVVVRQEKSLDLLQAILVHLAWGLFHFYIDVDTTTFTHMAHALIVDLKLDSSPDQNHISRQSLLGAAWTHLNQTHLFRRKTTHSAADRRAIMGFYHISSAATSLFRRGPCLRWTRYMSQMCDALSSTDTEQLDKVTSALARLQHIADDGFNALPGFEQFYGTSNADTPDPYNRSYDMAVTLTRRDMDNFVKDQHPHIQESDLFQLLYRVLLIRLYEPLINLQPTPSDANSLQTSPLRRTENLWKLVDACAEFFRYHLSLDTSSLSCFPFTVTGFLAYAIVTSSRVMLHEAEDWDPTIAQQHFDYAATAVRLGNQFEEADAWAQRSGRRQHMLDSEKSMFGTYGQKMRWIAHWYSSRIKGDVGAEQQAVAAFPTSMSNSASGASAGQDAEQRDFSQLPINFASDFTFDDGFWQDIFMYQPGSYGAMACGPEGAFGVNDGT